MAWNKKITSIGAIFIIAFFMGACQSQQTGFVGLYVDKSDDQSTASLTEESSALSVEPVQSVQQKTETTQVVKPDSMERVTRMQQISSGNAEFLERLELSSAVLNSLSQLHIRVDSVEDQLKVNSSILRSNSQDLQDLKLIKLNIEKPLQQTQFRTQYSPLIVTDSIFLKNEAPLQLRAAIKNDSILIVTYDSVSNNELVQRLYQEIPARQNQIGKGDFIFTDPVEGNEMEEKIDTTLIILYYEMGKTTSDSYSLESLNELLRNENITKIEISGYTDASGNKAINERITNSRINYMYSKISSYISVKKIFTQNFGETFASETIIPEERKLEIRIFDKRN